MRLSKYLLVISNMNFNANWSYRIKSVNLEQLTRLSIYLHRCKHLPYWGGTSWQLSAQTVDCSEKYNGFPNFYLKS